MKKSIFALFGLVLIILSFSILGNFKNLDEKANLKEMEALLLAISSAAERTKEVTKFYPDDFASMGFVPSCEKIIIKYKVQGETFVASAFDKVTGKSLSIDSTNKLSEGDILAGDSEAKICAE